MKKLIIFIGIFLCCFILYAQEDSFEVKVSGDNATITHKGIIANCSAHYQLITEQNENKITVIERDITKEKFKCMCNFDIDIKFKTFRKGVYDVEIYREELKEYNYPSDTLYLVGKTSFEIVVGLTMPPTSIDYLQSDCYSTTGVIDNVYQYREPEVYPMPCNNDPNLSFTVSSPGNAEIKIFNITGMLVKEYKINGLVAGKNTVRLINLDIRPGFYNCIINPESELPQITKILIN
jgi:hypothetical protein